jgi:PAS domain S-box-containing protein
MGRERASKSQQDPEGSGLPIEGFRAALQQAPNAILMVNQWGQIVQVNAHAEKLFGYSSGELLGRPVEILVPESSRRFHAGSSESFLSQPEARPMGSGRDLRGRRKDGELFPLEIGLCPIKAAEGNCVLGLIVDITERKRAEDSLRESEERFRAIFSQAAVGIAQSGISGEWMLVNDRFCEILGYTRAELRGMTFLQITHEDDRAAALAAAQRLLAGEIASHSTERRCVSKDGAIVSVQLFVTLVRDQEQVPQYFITVLEDVTAKVEAERALRESERHFALAQSAAHLGVWDWDLRTDAVETAGEFAKLYGLAPGHGSLTHEDWLRLVHPDDRERVQSQLRETIEWILLWEAEFRVMHPDGKLHWLLSKGEVFLDDAGKPVRMAGVDFDITERKQAEAARLESQTEQRFRKMADAAPIMIWVSALDKRCTFFNKRWLTFTGRTMEEELGEGWTEGVHPEDLDRCLAVYASSFDARRDFQVEYRLRRADGEYRWILDNGQPRFGPDGAFAGYNGSCIDITELKRTQEEAFDRQKLESLGVLAGGIAHDFNNLLGSILADSELVLEDLPAGSVAQEGVRNIRTVAIRAAEIVRELMAYAGQESPVIEPVDVSGLVSEMLHLLKVSISKLAVLKTELAQGLPAARANAAQIRRVVMNLITNASESLGGRGGVITISTSLVKKGRESAGDGATRLPPGHYLQLAVSDTGCGMTEEEQARIFDPFYTTKFAGRGLGLAAVQGIMRSHGGGIDLVSTPGHGTTFQILLPTAGHLMKSVVRKTVTDARAPVRHACGRVLLVEDEETLRRSVSSMLRRKGFSVIDTGDGYSAIDLLRTHKDPLDVVLLDMNIPGCSSREVTEEARRVRPEIKVILTTAYSREMAAPYFQAPQVAGFIRKPYQMDDLMRLLRDMLAG